MQYGMDYPIGNHAVPNNTWSELRCMESGRGDFAVRDGISALALDCSKELIWVGTNSGMVHAHLAGDLKRVISTYLGTGGSTTTVDSGDSVRSLVVAPTNVLAAVSRGLCVLSRGGVSRSTFFADTLADPRALALNPVLEGQVCIGGASEKLAIVDWESQRILRQASQRVPSTVTNAQWAVFPDSRSMTVFATQTGRISLCDPSSMREFQAAAAFTGSVTSISCRGNIIAATGCTTHGGVAYAQQLIKLFDVRYFNSPLPSVPFPAGPSLTAFDRWTNEAFCGGSADPLWGLSISGTLQCFDVSSGHSFPALSSELQLDSGPDSFTCMAVSSQGLLVLGDSGGFLHEWSANNYAQISEEAEPIFLTPITKAPLTRSDSELSRHLNRMLTSESVVTIPRFVEHDQEQDSGAEYLTNIIFKHLDRPERKHRNTYTRQNETSIEHLYEEVFSRRPWARFPLRPSDQVLNVSKRQSSVPYAQAPPGFVRNSMYGHKPAPVVIRSAKKFTRTSRPRISPGIAKELSSHTESTCRYEASNEETLDSASNIDLALPSVRSKFVEIDLVAAENISGFDFLRYNRSGLFCGLENALSNVYVNAAVQALYFSPPLRSFMLKHACDLEGCITCELGFLFHMIDIGGPGMACEAGNFTKAFMKMANADALGLLDGKTSLPPSQRIENFTRYLLEQLHKDDENTEESAVSKLLGGDIVSSGCFNQSRTEWIRSSRPFQHTLAYEAEGRTAESFCEMLEISLSRNLDTTRAYCEITKEFETMSQRRELKSLPSMLLLGCNTKASQSVEWWCKGQDTHFGGPGVGVEYMRSPSSEIELERVAKHTMQRSGRLVESIRMEIIDHQVSCSDISDGTLEEGEHSHAAFGYNCEGNTNDELVANKMQDTGDSLAEYDLAFVIAFVPPTVEEASFSQGTSVAAANHQGHLVSYIRVPNAYKERKMAKSVTQLHGNMSSVIDEEHGKGMRIATEAQSNGDGTSSTNTSNHERKDAKWYCFNDFVIAPCDGFQEVKAFDSRWKVPCLLAYVRRDIGARMQVYGDKDQECKLSVREVIGGESKNRAVGLLDDEETPGPGTLFALDCEFVMTSRDEAEIWGDGSRRVVSPAKMALGRVSVIRASGPRKGLPLIDDYVHVTERIVDYLTRFSGLREGDCDPGRSRFVVDSLKTVYKRLRCLVDAGCVFIGHGLKTDFRIINFIVPPHQVIDTVMLFRAAKKRLLGLRFLTTTLLKGDIQSTTHDSVEDADAAMQLYDLHKSICKDGSDPVLMRRFHRLLQALYSYGFLNSFRADPANPFDMEFALNSPHQM